MTLTASEASALLPFVTNAAELRDLVSRIDCSSPPGSSLTLLYSGRAAYFGDNDGDPDNLSSAEVARSVSDFSPGIRVIDRTEVARFLDLYSNPGLAACLERIFGDDPTDRRSSASQFLCGDRTTGVRQPNGLWDDASRRFVAEAKGQVITITGGAQADGVFSLTELPELLANPEITHIDGIGIDVLRSLGPEQAFQAIRAQSEVRAAELRLAVDGKGVPLRDEQMVVDARLYLTSFTDLSVDAPESAAPMRPLGDFVPSDRLPGHQDGAGFLRSHRDDLLAEAAALAPAGPSPELSRVLTALDHLGTAADVIDLALLAHQAVSLYQSGETEAAQRLLTDWALRNAGALAVGRLASLAVAPLLTAGPVGVVVAAALMLAAGLAGDQAGASLASWLQDGIADWTPAFIGLLQERFDRPSPPPRPCPLILDLDGDGVETISWQASAVHFDHDGNGFAERSGWVSPDDALLVRDRNGDGRIDTGGELFGNNTLLSSGNRAANGFEALRELDADRNGFIDAADPGWSELRLWRDGDGDGGVDPGELLRPEALAVQSLSLAYSEANQLDGAGNAHRQLGSYRRSDGNSGDLRDVWFGANVALSRVRDFLPVDPEVAVLPDLPGLGVVPSLHQAMVRDGSGQLRAVLRRWIAADAAGRESLLDAVLLHWAGVASVDPAAYGPAVADGRRVAALEAFLADRYRDGALPDAFGADQLEQAFTSLRRRVAARLVLQVDLAPILADLSIEAPEQGRAPNLVVADAVTRLQARLASAADPEAEARALSAHLHELPVAPLVPLFEGARRAAPAAPDGLVLPLLAVGAERWIREQNGISTLLGGPADELFEGGPWGNWIDAGAGDDVLVGGGGDDHLLGGAGRNTFLFGRGDGRDWIAVERALSAGASNTLSFRAGIRPSDLVVSQDWAGTVSLSLDGSTDIVWIEGLQDPRPPSEDQGIQRLDWITFVDGTRWSADDLRFRLTQGTDAPDALRGSYRPDSLWGGAGNDSLIGFGGDDRLDGGSGGDWLEGGSGSDTYVIGRDQGSDQILDQADGGADHDIILFGPGIRPADLRFSRWSSPSQTDLLVSGPAVGVGLQILSFFGDGAAAQPWPWALEEFRFDDGSVLSDADIRRQMLAGDGTSQVLIGYAADDRIDALGGDDTLYGLGGNDQLIGGEGRDLLIGGTGDDRLEGGGGMDRYLLEGASGRDLIVSRHRALNGDPAQLEIGAGTLAADQIVLRRVDNDLEIAESGSVSGNAVLIQDYFRDESSANLWNPVQTIVWRSGLSWDLATIDAHVANIYRGGRRADQLVGSDDSDFLEGLAGDDSLTGGEGHDRLDGGDGSDTASWAPSTAAVRVDLTLVGPQDTGAGRDTLVAIENLIGGSGSDRLLGNAGDNRIDGGAGDDCIDGGSGSDVLIGGSGIDTVSYATATAAVTVDLASTRSQRTGGSGSDLLTGFEQLEGSSWNDTLSGSAAADRIEGGGGDDLIRGGAGADQLIGGTGADRFSYGSISEAGTGAAGWDQILDLESADRIDLALIDANSTVRGNQAFVFIGSAPFTAPGQLRYGVADGLGLLEGNVDAGLSSDFQLVIGGAPALSADWLVL